jgi:hypothetical protein
MRFALDFHPLVKVDIAEAECWYQAIQPRVAGQLLSEVEAEFAALSGYASLGPSACLC